MTREDLNGKNFQEIEPMLTQELNDYKTIVDGVMDIEELTKMEETLMEEAKKYDEYLNSVEYDLPERVEHNNTNYSRNEVAKFITRALNKMEVEWSQTLGLFELVNLWRTKDMSKIASKAYDSTLRVLNQVKYKGYDEWNEILAVNKFLSSCHSAYSLDTSWNILISEKHNAIMQRAELLRKEDGIVDEAQIVMEGV